jgi:hypothetical protein
LFSLQIQFIQNTSYANQLFSNLFSNGELSAVRLNTSYLDIEIFSVNYSIPNRTSCSCILDPFSCASPSAIYGDFDFVTNEAKILLPMPTFQFGCFAIDSLFLSTLECFYDQSCLDLLQPYIPSFNLTILNRTSTSQYQSDTPIGEIIENLLVETWNLSISYENYFSICAPQLCTYAIEEREDFLCFLTTLFSLFGGLTIVLRIISPYLSLLISIRFHRQNQNRTPWHIQCKYYLKIN